MTPLQAKQLAFIAKLRGLGSNQQREFIAQQLSQDTPDTMTQFKHPGIEKLDTGTDMEIILRQRQKAQDLLRQPL